MKKILVIACVGFLYPFAIKTAFSAEQVNFSGRYSEVTTKSAIKADPTLVEVVQSDANIEITKVESTKRTVSRCPLDGSEGDYVSPGGAAGKCKAFLKGKYLMIEFLVVSRPQPGASAVRIRTRERWQLSADSKTLTVKSDVDFPDFPAAISGAVADDTSGTRKYTRTDTP